MARYVLRRTLSMIPLLLFLTSMVFLLGQYGAGDLAAYLTVQQSGGRFDADVYKRTRERLQLDDPVYVRYGRWLWNAAHGDLGVSYAFIGEPKITALIKRALPVSGQLGLAALLVLVVLGIPLGIIAALSRNSWLDFLIVGGSTVISSIPSFVLAPIAMIILVAELKLIPYVGLGWHGVLNPRAILPVFVLAVGPLLRIVRFTRTSVLEVLSQDYVRASRAKGLSQLQVITRHVVKNSLTPVITILGVTAGHMLAGSIFVERIFNLNGFGFLAADALEAGDVLLSTGVLLVSGLFMMSINLIVDLSYGVLDPRVDLTA